MPLSQTASAAGGDPLIALDGTGPLRDQLTRAVRTAIRDGRLATGSTLPASRTLAESLGVSRWVVTQAYAELVSDGVLEARTGSATRVGAAAWLEPPAAGRWSGGPRDVGSGSRAVAPRPSARPRYDLAPGVPDLRHVPRAAWARAARDAVMTAPASDLLTTDPFGAPEVRAVLAARLATSRAVVADLHAVVVTHGSSDGFARVARALVADGHRAILVEDPGWPVLRHVAEHVGLTPVPVPVDTDGIDTDALAVAAARSGARAVLVTPAHQFPTGSVLAPARREALVRWARSVDGVVLEDDYDAEFRYDRRPVAALQGLAPDRVVLIGSVSKTLAPAFGIGWLVGPRWLLNSSPPAGAAGSSTRHGGPGLDPSVSPPSVLHQLAFASLVGDGSYDRHLRAARTRYRRRRAALLEALAAHLPALPVTGVAAGLHAVLALPDGVEEGRVVRLAGRRHVHVVPAGRYRVVPDGRPAALVLGYGNLVDALLPEAVARLAEAVRAS
ncbi:MocR-like pyridoxine biosynthesis transcription factor PdxR [Cellulomonas sp. URHB0016]